MCRLLSQEFGVVRLFRTFSTYIYTGETRFAGCLCTSSGWFKSIEPPRTFSNHIMTGCVDMWFDCTEPTSLQGKQGLRGAYALVRVVQAHRTSSNLLELHHRRDSKVCRVLPHEFGVVRTFSSYGSAVTKVRYSRTSPNSCEGTLL